MTSCATVITIAKLYILHRMVILLVVLQLAFVKCHIWPSLQGLKPLSALDYSARPRPHKNVYPILNL